MNEKSFKFKERYFEALSNLNEKQSGRLLKGICEYAYNGTEFKSKDENLNRLFALIKSDMDDEKQVQERSEYGGNVNIIKHNSDDSVTFITADLGKQKCSLQEFLGEAVIAINTDYNALRRNINEED